MKTLSPDKVRACVKGAVGKVSHNTCFAHRRG